MLSREESAAADGEETKGTFCPSSLPLHLFHAKWVSLFVAGSPYAPPPPSFLSIHFYQSWVIAFFPLFHFSQLSTSPSLTPLQLSHNSALLSGQSEHSVEIGSVTVSLETDRVWLPGVSAQQKSKTAVTSVKSSYLSHSQSPSVCVRSCRQLLCEYGFERLSACLWMCLHPGIIIISIDLNFLS